MGDRTTFALVDRAKRPVAVAEASDGSLYVTDEGGGHYVWRVVFTAASGK